MTQLRIKPTELTHAKAVRDLLREFGASELLSETLHRAIADGLRERSLSLGKQLVKSGNYRKAYLPK